MFKPSRISIILVKKSLYSNTFLGIFIFIKWYTSNRLSLACGSIKMYKELMNNKKIYQNLLISFRWLFHIEDSEWILPLPERGTSRVRELLISVQMRPYNRQRIHWFQYSSLSEDLKRIRMYSSLCKICFIVWWFFFLIRVPYHLIITTFIKLPSVTPSATIKLHVYPVTSNIF